MWGPHLIASVVSLYWKGYTCHSMGSPKVHQTVSWDGGTESEKGQGCPGLSTFDIGSLNKNCIETHSLKGWDDTFSNVWQKYFCIQWLVND